MRTSKVIVAITRIRAHPIFQTPTTAFVGDLFEVVPL